MVTRNELRKLMTEAHNFVKSNGYSLSKALKVAWRNYKLVKKMTTDVVEFWFLKVDGKTTRRAYGSLSSKVVPETSGSGRRGNDSCQTYFDCGKNAWRCFKKANLLKVF